MTHIYICSSFSFVKGYYKNTETYFTITEGYSSNVESDGRIATFSVGKPIIILTDSLRYDEATNSTAYRVVIWKQPCFTSYLT